MAVQTDSGKKSNDISSPVQDAILSMMHGLWQQRSLSLIVAFEVPELLCNSEKPLSIEAIASATGCDSSTLLYPIMKVLAQWGIGEELDNKHFFKNHGMELLRRDKGPSLGHMLHHYGSEEHLTAMRMLPEGVRRGKPAFVLEHGMSHWEYMNDTITKPYDESKMVKGSSQHLIGSSERRNEFAQNYVDAMACVSNLSLLADQQGINNIYEVYSWSSCKRLVDVCGGNGYFISSVMKRPGCEDIQGFVIDLPDVIDEAAKNVHKLGVKDHPISFIKHDILQPVSNDIADIQADTVIMKNAFCIFPYEDKVTVLKSCKSLLQEGGRFLVIEACSPDPGDSEHNIGLNGGQIGFKNILVLSLHATCLSSVKETRELLEEVGNKAGYKLNQIYNTFSGGYTIFELISL